MFSDKAKQGFKTTLQEIKQAGLFKDERVILTPQGSDIKVKEGEVINFCANNYLGLSNHPKLVAAAKEGLEKYGYGMSSVRFICGTQDIHKTLEREISSFLGTDDTILYSSCFDANGGLFETLLDAECAIISDALNHASVIDGIRLCKAERKVYQHGDMADLEERLKETQNAKLRMVATDGGFSMDGDLAKLDKICDLADKYDAMVMVDDSHCTGFIGKTGRGTAEHYGVQARVDVITSTMGKAMGGASGGFTSGRQALIDMLRQRSRPYLFSNTLAPSIAYTAVAAFRMLKQTTQLRDTLEKNTKYFRAEMTAKGFDIRPGFHPIIPIMLGDAKLAHDMARDLLAEGIYVIGFSYPVVPKGQARIRVQISAAHTKEQLDKAIAAFAKIGKKYNVIK
ncbi:MAG TPA: glycine C-acetyltransferase [bacterium]|nr:glycine C-acetyltransferase [bacterium]